MHLSIFSIEYEIHIVDKLSFLKSMEKRYVSSFWGRSLSGLLIWSVLVRLASGRAFRWLRSHGTFAISAKRDKEPNGKFWICFQTARSGFLPHNFGQVGYFTWLTILCLFWWSHLYKQSTYLRSAEPQLANRALVGGVDFLLCHVVKILRFSTFKGFRMKSWDIVVTKMDLCNIARRASFWSDVINIYLECPCRCSVSTKRITDVHGVRQIRYERHLHVLGGMHFAVEENAENNMKGLPRWNIHYTWDNERTLTTRSQYSGFDG